jgi:NADH:ubiquinone oxidoreductase subunit B-like Fe-S oxidoreductase
MLNGELEGAELEQHVEQSVLTTSLDKVANWARGNAFMPVDMHIPGCPPRPEALAYGILKLRAMILSKPDEGWRTRYGGRGTEEFDPKVLEESIQAANAANVALPTGRGSDPGA